MAGRKSEYLGVAATVVLTILPLCAGAQTVEISWRPATPSRIEKAPRPLYFLPGGPLPELFSESTPLRLIDSFEDSEVDREHRREVLAQCDLLCEVRGPSALNVLAGLPNGMMGWVTGGLHSGPDRNEILSLHSLENRSLLPRLLSRPVDDATAYPFDGMVDQFFTRQRRYFARFQDSDFSTAAVEVGLEDIDSAALMEDQRDILFGVCRKLCFGSIGTRLDDRIRDEAFDITRWHSVDFVVAPAAVAGYVYVFGWEKKVNLLGLRCAFQIEPIHRILERLESSHDDLVSAAGVEIGVGNFPVKAIVSVGIMDVDALVDFVGIGTSLGKARQVVTQALSALQGGE